MKKHPDVEKVLLTEAGIRKGVVQVARRISRDYAGEELTLVGILKGSVVFFSDLLRALSVPCTVDFISVASYGSRARSSGSVRLLMDLRENPAGKNLLLVEDILDTGLTMKFLLDNLSARGPKSLKVCAFLDKPGNRLAEVKADYTGFTIPAKYVVGYGLDYNERYRNLPYLGILKKEVYQNEK